ncbi:hypothetical protein ABZ372_53480, partial [Streptomyces sp. NPDC005921]
MVSRSRTRRITGAFVSFTAVGLLASCVPGTTGAGTANSAGKGAVATDPAAMGKVTLNVLDTFSGGTDNTWMTSVVKTFETAVRIDDAGQRGVQGQRGGRVG